MTTEILRNMLYRVGDEGATTDDRLKVRLAAFTWCFTITCLFAMEQCGWQAVATTSGRLEMCGWSVRAMRLHRCAPPVHLPALQCFIGPC